MNIHEVIAITPKLIFQNFLFIPLLFTLKLMTSSFQWQFWKVHILPVILVYDNLYDNTRRNLKQRWGILATENLLITIVTCQFLVNTVFPYSGLLQL